jgi:hypothetical protein
MTITMHAHAGRTVARADSSARAPARVSRAFVQEFDVAPDTYAFSARATAQAV